MNQKIIDLMYWLLYGDYTLYIEEDDEPLPATLQQEIKRLNETYR